MDKKTYESLPLTRWLDELGKPIEDHPELPSSDQETKILGRQLGTPVELLLKSKLVRETLKAKGYDLEEVKVGRTTVGPDLMRLLKELADNQPADTNEKTIELELSIMRMTNVGPRGKN